MHSNAVFPRILCYSALMALTASAFGCNAEEKGRARAKVAAAEERARHAAEVGPPIVAQKPPVADHGLIGCETLINSAAFTEALGETEPIEVADVTAQDRDAAAVCAIRRGGVRPTPAEQAALLKKNGKLGVIPGDPICSVYAYCWTFEDGERFEKKCRESSKQFDDSLGFPACVQTFATGEHDVKQYQLYDDDTKCLFKIGAGPAMVDNDVIANCAKAAEKFIGPSNIIPGGPPADAADADADEAPVDIKL